MSKQFKIDKDIPIPNPSGHVGSWTPLLEKLEVGDSFFVPDRAPDQIAARAPANKLGIKITMRQWEEPDGSRGTRIWRTE